VAVEESSRWGENGAREGRTLYLSEREDQDEGGDTDLGRKAYGHKSKDFP
jgi:hypothetical protein